MIEKYVDAEELRRLLSTLIVVLCGLAIAGLFAILVVPGLRNANRPPTPASVSPVVRESGWLDPAEFPPARGRVIPPVDPRSLIAASPELSARGKEIYESTCMQCHGVQGRGDGPAAGTMNPRPRNLASPGGWMNGYGLPGIYKTLTDGIPNTSMTSYSHLSRNDRMAAAHYVQSLGNFPHGVGSPEAMQALYGELASAGEKIPNRIPVSMAMDRLEKEYAAQQRPEFLRDISAPEYAVARRVIRDPSRAARVLAQSRVWRGNAHLLAEYILPGIPGNGFSVASASLSPLEWKDLHQLLLKRLETAEER